MVYRVYVEKKPAFRQEADSLAAELRTLVGVTGLESLRILNRYDLEGISEELFLACRDTVFGEPPVDDCYDECPAAQHVFAVEYLPGQFDQRAESAAQCIQLISQGERPAVRTAKVYLLEGQLDEADIAATQKYVINPVEARLAGLKKPGSLAISYPAPGPVEVLHGFCALDAAGLAAFRHEKRLAMDEADIACCQAYFKGEGREPTLAEIRMLDTYWSDHCRHTTFGTILDKVELEDSLAARSFQRYLGLRKALYAGRQKPVCLMDLATIGAKALKANGKLNDLDESEEINACTVKITCDVNGKEEPWLFLFKNETHNHPTEIEPFGGAATCIGGAIRDPLSGRSYVYQAMRVTGAGDPLAPVSGTLPGKLPQRKLVIGAANGYSSYGNQVGLATGLVEEIYHPGYAAKRLEIGAVVGAAPAANVRREAPLPGDLVVLLGGRTGRDGCGGATGSSKAHERGSLEACGAEVQKGNPPEERKLQRLFRNPAAARLIKRCNDFGAGGVSVAVGELADGLEIDLDAVPKKYDGLSGIELAISESQERMAVVLSPKDLDAFLKLAGNENLEATVVARVTERPRLVMRWDGEAIVDISRDFLSSNGAEKHADVKVEAGELFIPEWPGDTLAERLTALVGDLNVCCQKGLAERFDSTIGAASVLMPFGGRWQLTPAQAMVAKLPVEGETTTCSGMAWGFEVHIAEKSPWHGGYLAVVESVSKLVATGFAPGSIHLTFQEYFERLGADPARWGKPVAALLGALEAQLGLGLAAIGGKDSMSGSFEKLDVPPTLVSFAAGIGRVGEVHSPEFKKPGSAVVLLRPQYTDPLCPDADSLLAVYAEVGRLMAGGKVLAAATPGYGGVMACLFKMGLGNRLGFALADGIGVDALFKPAYGSFVLELADGAAAGELLGRTTAAYQFAAGGETVELGPVCEVWQARLEPVTPWRRLPNAPEEKGEPGAQEQNSENAAQHEAPPTLTWQNARPKPFRRGSLFGRLRPRVVIPVFPGTNCEYDTARAFRAAGAEPQVLVVQNLTPAAVAESCAALAKAIRQSQIVMLPGGFSGGDEPDGSAKFITAFFRSAAVSEAVAELLQKRDGLILGICNGFQALIKLGLVPYGEICPLTAQSPTLTYNTIGRHQSMLVRTRVASSLSPWFCRCEPGEVYTVPVSHGEGRFVAGPRLLKELAGRGQVATQYVGLDGAPGMQLTVNPNGSVWAIEGITSPDGRVLGKMGHTERCGAGLYKNVPGNADMPLFEGGVAYFGL